MLDVRHGSEIAEGHVAGAVNVPYERLAEHLDRVPGGQPLFVHCQTVARSAVASAFLAARGLDVTDVDDRFPRFGEIGGDVATGPE